MLSRRNIRIKVMQTLYAYEQNPSVAPQILEKNLLKSLENPYRLYLYNLLVITTVAEQVVAEAEIKAAKHLPTEADKHFSTRIYNNVVLQKIVNDEYFKKQVNKEKLTYMLDETLINKYYKELKASKEYQEYGAQPDTGIAYDKSILIYLYKKIILKDEEFHKHFEDIMPSWPDDKDLVIPPITKTIDAITPASDRVIDREYSGDWEEDQKFAVNLLNSCLNENEALQVLIAPKVQNWEVDRIAMIDMILMKMALSELLYFPQIPVKVSINEYIDISKVYSTPKSKDFINGVLDKIMKELKEAGKIRKTGRGLVE